MPAQALQLYLLAYDIAEPKRLARVHRQLKAWGLPLQYSVWLVPARRAEIEQLCKQLESLIDNADDDVRIYALPARPQVVSRGRPRLQPGICLVGERRIDQAVSAFLGDGIVSGTGVLSAA